ncbi:MAG: M42 family metallopeptidase [Firmicutes bacterium]|nr:M42 family metallopeptidase [Bacillota bacterium]
MEIKDFLEETTQATGASGYETQVASIFRRYIEGVSDEVWTDPLGNVIAVRRGPRENSPKIMLAGHMDEIGLVITRIEDGGFLRFTKIGGIDERTLLAQEVRVHGRSTLTGVIGAKPPHIQEPDERRKSVPMDKLFIDVGLEEEKVRELVSVGDIATIKRKVISLNCDTLAGKAMDDRAGVAVVLATFRELVRLKSQVTVYGVATVQEEVGTRGAQTSTYGIDPDIGIGIDVTFADRDDLVEERAKLGKGPVIAIGPQVHPKVYQRMVETARKRGIDYQIDPSPHPFGTDTAPIQVARSGVASILVSIPLRYMHTSVETLKLRDIEAAGRLLAEFISSIDAEFVEGLSCF